jgi:RNA polymerase sigma-70 factor (ECF subfamily)
VGEGVVFPLKDEIGWVEQFEEQRRALLRHCTRLVGPDEAQDVVQDTYLKAARHIGSIRNPAATRAWLFRVASNRCVDVHRRRRRLVALGDRDLVGSVGRDIALRQVIEGLSPRERAIVVMHYAHGFGLQEIAERLGLTHTNTRSILFRTRARMRIALSEAAGVATDAA